MLLGHGENRAGLVGRERAALDKHVAECSQFFGGDRRNHLLANELHISSAILSKLRRDDVGAEKCSRERARKRVPQSAIDAEQLQLISEGQAISALALDSGHAESEHSAEETTRAREEFLF